jgi:6-hydroxytryprostatin B O-methyltransferase
MHDLSTMNAMNKLNFWDAVPLSGNASYRDIASKTGAPEEAIRRILRHSMTAHIFAETAPGADTVKHTVMSAAFVHDRRLRSWVGHNLEEVLPAAINLPQALEHYQGNLVEPNRCAGAYTFFRDESDGKGWFQWYMRPDERWRAARFGEAMTYLTQNPALNLKMIHRMYDWAALGTTTFIDIGGSVGHISFELAQSNLHMSCVVQDLPDLGAPFAAAVPDNLKGRVTFQPHDFFKPQPILDADVYFLKHILHDWSDPYAAKIIRQIVPAMTKPGVRLLIMEGIVPPPGQAPLPIARLMSSLDMQMMTALNSKERTVDDWVALLAMADDRLQLKGVHMPEGAGFALLEVALKA